MRYKAKGLLAAAALTSILAGPVVAAGGVLPPAGSPMHLRKPIPMKTGEGEYVYSSNHGHSIGDKPPTPYHRAWRENYWWIDPRSGEVMDRVTYLCTGKTDRGWGAECRGVRPPEEWQKLGPVEKLRSWGTQWVREDGR